MGNNEDGSKLVKAKDWLLNNIGFLLIVGIFFVYVGKTFIDVGLTGKSVAQIIVDGIFTLLFGWTIKSTMGEQGILKGLASKDLINTKKVHSEQTIRIKDYRPKLNDFCLQKTIELRIKRRTEILARKNLQYSDVFCDDPDRLEKVIEERLSELKNRLEKLNEAAISKDRFFKIKLKLRLRAERKSIMRTVKKAWRVKVTELTSGGLTSDGGRPDDPYDFGETIQEYTAKKSVSKLAFALCFMIIFGIANVGFKAWDLGAFIWAMVQMFTMVASGSWSLFRSYMFIIDRYRKGIIKKIDLLEEFEISCKQGKDFNLPQEIIITKVGEKNEQTRQEFKQLSSIQEQA